VDSRLAGEHRESRYDIAVRVERWWLVRGTEVRAFARFVAHMKPGDQFRMDPDGKLVREP
jgi:hypothetical protein